MVWRSSDSNPTVADSKSHMCVFRIPEIVGYLWNWGKIVRTICAYCLPVHLNSWLNSGSVLPLVVWLHGVWAHGDPLSYQHFPNKGSTQGWCWVPLSRLYDQEVAESELRAGILQVPWHLPVATVMLNISLVWWVSSTFTYIIIIINVGLRSNYQQGISFWVEVEFLCVFYMYSRRPAYSRLLIELCVGWSGHCGIVPGKLAQRAMRPSHWQNFQKDSKLVPSQEVEKKKCSSAATRQVCRFPP